MCIDSTQRGGGACPRRHVCRECATSIQSPLSIYTTHEAVMPTKLTWLLCKIGHRLLFRFLYYSPLSSLCGGSIGDFGLISPIRSLWCHKSTLWVDTPIMLVMYVFFTILFYCILKFSLEYTHVVGIWDESDVIVISMEWLCYMND
jgi:hypothetical protein